MGEQQQEKDREGNDTGADGRIEIGRQQGNENLFGRMCIGGAR